jgi:hypothetical protein
MKLRRIVTGRDRAGKSRVAVDGPPPMTHDFVHIPGMQVARLWATVPCPGLPSDFADPTLTQTSIVPRPGGTQFLVVTFPPDAVMMSGEFDPAAAGAENLAHVPGLAEQFEPDEPGMHTTDTIDYGVVLDGNRVEPMMTESALRRHDVVIDTAPAMRGNRDSLR